MLQEVAAHKRALPYKKYNKDLGHKAGMAAGRYPEKTIREILKILDSAEMNAQFKGLNSSKLHIAHVAAHKASSPLHSGRHRGRHMKRTHVEIILEEREEKKKVERKVRHGQNKEKDVEKKEVKKEVVTEKVQDKEKKLEEVVEDKEQSVEKQPVEERIDTDGSSVYLTTNQKLEFTPGIESKVVTSPYEGKNILLSSDRIIFNTKNGGDIGGLSNNNVSIGAVSEVVIESPVTKIGSSSATEPLVLGDK